MRKSETETIYINRATYDGTTIYLNSILEFAPKLTDDKQHVTIEDKMLGINVIAESRKGILNELNYIIYIIWKEYVESDENMVPKAMELKEIWKSLIKTVEILGG